MIFETLQETPHQTLCENWGTTVNDNNRLLQWCDLCVANYATTQENLGYAVAKEVLETIFSIYEVDEDVQQVVAEK